MVSVPCERGYTIGFVAREVYEDEVMNRFATTNWKPKKIHTHLFDEDNSIKQTLKTKIDTENFALSHCKVLMRGHRSGSLAEVLGTEFQYDNKRLTVYLKKFEDLSVCRLVRKLNEKFRTRISVVEVDSIHEMQERALRYLTLSQLDLTIDRLSNGNNEKTSQSFLLLKYQQLNGITTANGGGTGTACNIGSEDILVNDYQHYGPFTNKKSTQSKSFDETSISSTVSATSSSSSSASSIFHTGLANGNIGQSRPSSGSNSYPSLHHQQQQPHQHHQQPPQHHHHQPHHQHHHLPLPSSSSPTSSSSTSSFSSHHTENILTNEFLESYLPPPPSLSSHRLSNDSNYHSNLHHSSDQIFSDWTEFDQPTGSNFKITKYDSHDRSYPHYILQK